MEPATKNYSRDGIFTTERFIEVNRQAGINVQRINPEINLDFYLGKAARSAYDRLRAHEIMVKVFVCDSFNSSFVSTNSIGDMVHSCFAVL